MSWIKEIPVKNISVTNHCLTTCQVCYQCVGFVLHSSNIDSVYLFLQGKCHRGLMYGYVFVIFWFGCLGSQSATHREGRRGFP